jgi:hypothetical protein
VLRAPPGPAYEHEARSLGGPVLLVKAIEKVDHPDSSTS